MSVESIYWYWIYPTKNWGNCVIWRISVHLLGAGLGKVHSVIYIFVLDICCQHLGYMRHLEGFYVPFGHKVRECTFCNIYIYLYWIYATNNWGKCVSWRVSVHFLGAGPALHCRV